MLSAFANLGCCGWPEKIVWQNPRPSSTRFCRPLSVDFQKETPEFVLRIFQRFRLLKFIEKFKTHIKNLKIGKIFAFDKYLHELFFSFYFHHSKKLFLTLKINEVADLTHFLQNAAVFKVYKNNETVDCRQTFLNSF